MNRSFIIFLATAAILLLAIGGWIFLSTPKTAEPKPATAVAPQAPPPAQTPPTEEDMAKSLAFPVTVVSVGDQSITVLIDEAQVTLPIDQWTSLVALNSIKDIKPNSTLGIRLTADKKRVLVLNGTWMK